MSGGQPMDGGPQSRWPFVYSSVAVVAATTTRRDRIHRASKGDDMTGRGIGFVETESGDKGIAHPGALARQPPGNSSTTSEINPQRLTPIHSALGRVTVLEHRPALDQLARGRFYQIHSAIASLGRNGHS